MTTSVPELPDSRAVFRRTLSVRKRWQRLGVRFLVAAVALAAGASVLGTQLLVVAGLSGVMAIVCGGVYLAEGRFRTVLTPGGIATRGYIRRTIPWAEVAGFRLQGPVRPVPVTADAAGGLGAGPRRLVAGAGLGQTPVWNDAGHGRRTYARPKRISIDVVRTSGRTARLPAPLVAGSGADPGFADAVRQLEQWRSHYGLSVPPPVGR